MKTSNDKFVGQSVSYEITERYRTESVSFHLKYWLKLTYPVVAAVTIPWSRQRRMLPNYVMSKIECGQLHSELFGRRHSTLQSHGLFALAKHLPSLLLIFSCFSAVRDEARWISDTPWWAINVTGDCTDRDETRYSTDNFLCKECQFASNAMVSRQAMELL